MKKKLWIVFLFLFSKLLASNVATQTIVFSITPISEIAISGSPCPMIASQACAGNDVFDVVDDSTFYAVTSNGSSEKLFSCLDNQMPPGTALLVLASAPIGATSTGIVNLDVAGQTLVTGISQTAQSNLQISYIFRCTTAAGILAPTSRIVTFTLSP